MTFQEVLSVFENDPLGKKKAKKECAAGEILREKFVGKYTIDNIKNMSIEEYLISNTPSFCSSLDNELCLIGETRGQSRISKFGVYKKDNRILYTKKYGNNVPEAFENIKKEIEKLFPAGRDEDFKEIEKNMLAPTVKGKLLYIYYPDKYLSVYSYDDVKFFADKLGIAYEKDTAVHEIKKRILEFKEKSNTINDMNTLVFSSCLYYWKRLMRKEQKKRYER